MERSVPDVHPIQLPRHRRGTVRKEVALRAYEVYCDNYGPQQALITDHCRGGFSVGELIAFLYARSFPREQWKRRADEAFLLMDTSGDG